MPCQIARLKPSLVGSVAVPDGIATLGLQLVDARVHVVVGTAHEVVPAVALTGKLQTALLPDVVEGERGLGHGRRDGASAHGIEGIQGGATRGLTLQHLCLSVYEIDVGEAQDVCSEVVGHATSRSIHLGLVVEVVAIGVLHVLHTAGALELTRGSGVVRLVVVELQDVETGLAVAEVLVAPEVAIDVAGTHHRGLAAHVGIDALRWILRHVVAKGILQVGRRATPATPAVAVLVETRRHEVALQGVLRGPLCTVDPAPSNEALVADVFRTAEDVLVVCHELAAGVLDDVERSSRCALQVVVVERTGHAGSGEQHLCIEALGAVVVDAA